MRLILKEDKAKLQLSEGMKYHLENKLSLDESEFRMGSIAWCDLVNEVRSLYFGGYILISEAEKAIIESNAGSFGEYNGEDVPLDAPFPIDEAGNFAVFCLNENNETVRVVFSEAKDSLLNEIEHITDIESKYPISINVKYHISDVPAIYIQSIIVDKDKRREGIGSKAMQDIIDWADKKHVIITLTPENTFGTPVSVLEKFYKRFGFVKNKGKNKDYRFLGSLIRYPKTISLTESLDKTSSITAYHGSNVKHNSLVTDYVGGENANDEQGPGLYFTTDKADAMKYGAYLYTVNLTLKNIISDRKRVSKTDLNLAAKLIKSKDEETWQSIAQNWHMNPIIGLKKAIRDSADVDSQKDFFLNVWYDWFLYDAKSFVDGMVNLGFDGLEISEPYKSSWGAASNFKHYIVYNPKCIIIQSIDTVDMMNETVDNYKMWKRKNVTLRGIKTLGQPNNVSGQFGKGLYTVPLSNKSMAKQYGDVYFVVNAVPKNPIVVDSLNGAEMWRQKLMIDFCEKHGLPFDIRHFEANTTIEDEMLKLGYDGIIIKGREMVNYAPENIRYFKTESELVGYYERTFETL